MGEGRGWAPERIERLDSWCIQILSNSAEIGGGGSFQLFTVTATQFGSACSWYLPSLSNVLHGLAVSCISSEVLCTDRIFAFLVK